MSKTDSRQRDRHECLERIGSYLTQLERRIDELIDGDVTVSPPTRRFIHYKLDRARRIVAAAKRLSADAWPIVRPELEDLLADLVADVGRACPAAGSRVARRPRPGAR